MLAQQIVNGLMLGSIYVLVAVAFTLTIGILNFLNFSIPGIFMLGGMFTWALFKGGVHWLPAVATALAVGALASLLVERFTYRWLRTTDHIVPLVSSMGFLILFENLVMIRWGTDLHRVASPFADLNLRIAGVIISAPQLVGLIFAVLLVAALSVLLKRTSTGRALRAIAEDSDTALVLGIDIDRIVPMVFVISGLFTSLAGVIFALNYLQVSPVMGEEIAFKGISAMVIGGMGSVWGAIAGGLLIGLSEVLAISLLGSTWVDVAVYGLLLLLLFIKPSGLFGVAALGKGKF